MRGKLIVLEGIDGSGKSTQFKLLCDAFKTDNIQYRKLTFPRYDEPSSMLIRMYLDGQFGTDPDSVNAYAASSFFAVDRYASYVQDWHKNYEKGCLILTDRYTTSNAIHQGAKMAKDERERYFRWLYKYEFRYMELPKPDLVFYMNIDAETAAKRLSSRQSQTNTHADIHEQNLSYLKACVQSGYEAAKYYKWHIIECVKENNERNRDDINKEIYTRIRALI